MTGAAAAAPEPSAAPGADRPPRPDDVGTPEPALTRLVSFVDAHDRQEHEGCAALAWLELKLADGRRALLLDDRGWSSSGGWTETSVRDVEDTARMVVGPDEPFSGRSHDDMAADHWAWLAQAAERQEVVMGAAEFRRLPHDVVLSPQLLARVGADASPASA